MQNVIFYSINCVLCLTQDYKFFNQIDVIYMTVIRELFFFLMTQYNYNIIMQELFNTLSDKSLSHLQTQPIKPNYQTKQNKQCHCNLVKAKGLKIQKDVKSYASSTNKSKYCCMSNVVFYHKEKVVNNMWKDLWQYSVAEHLRAICTHCNNTFDAVHIN